LAARCSEWPFSSFHRFVRDGLLAADWGGVASSTLLAAAEPRPTQRNGPVGETT
jgi:putative transposase